MPASAWGPDDSAPEDDDVMSPKSPKTPKTPMKSPLKTLRLSINVLQCSFGTHLFVEILIAEARYRYIQYH